MRSLPAITFSPTKDQLLAQIESVHRELIEFFRELPPDRMLVGANPDGWTGLKNLKHLISTNHTMSRYLSMPAWLLRLRGKPTNPDITVEQLVPTNRPFITDHGTYPIGKSLPGERLERYLSELERSADRLGRAVQGRSEEELDSLRSLFGGLTLRMFAHFVLKHNVYHTSVVRYRMENR